MARLEGSNLSKVRQHNSAYIREVIYKYGPLPRSRIAEMLDLSLPTITTKVADMIAHGSVREVGCGEREESALGRKARSVDFVPGAAYFVGVEIAPQKRAVCLTDLRANVLDARMHETDLREYGDVLDDVTAMIAESVAASGVARGMILGVGVGCPGFVESRQGRVRSFSRFGWTNRPLAQDLSARTGLRVRIENNARVRAIGEDLTSGKMRPDTFAYLFVSKGIGCPLYVKSSLFSGYTYSAGEVGHMVMDINGPRCATCGNRGCLEAFASDPAILERCRCAMASGVPTMLTALADSPEDLTLDAVLKACHCGDPVADSILHTAIYYLAVALANVVNFINPQLVIVDAFVMREQKNREFFLEALRKNLYGVSDTEVSIEFKDSDGFSGAKGAAALAIKQFFIKEG